MNSSESRSNTAQRSHHVSIFGLVSILVSLMFLTACSSTLKVRTDSDPTTDFSQFKTFNFFDPMGIEGGYNSPIYGQLFRESITNEMKQRNYVLGDSPDLLVNVTIRSDDRVKVTSYEAPYLNGAYYSTPGGAYYGSGLGVGVAVGRTTREVTEASVFIDLVDPKQKKVVWQGVAVFEATHRVAEHLRDATFTVVDDVFKKYPHQAGQ